MEAKRREVRASHNGSACMGRQMGGEAEPSQQHKLHFNFLNVI